jgi:hypothetical protein
MAAERRLNNAADYAQPPQVVDELPAAEVSKTKVGFEFTHDWFSGNIPIWKRHLRHLQGQPGVRMLEIGVFEGRSTVWLLQNLLTGPEARLDCIDTFAGGSEHHAQGIDMGSVERRFDTNIRRAGGESRVMKLRGASRQVLRTLDLEAYDAIYVDGSHQAPDVLEDAILAFHCLKHGGILIFDDYGWQWEWPELWSPRLGIDAFLYVYRERLELLHKEYQVLVRKL